MEHIEIVLTIPPHTRRYEIYYTVLLPYRYAESSPIDTAVPHTHTIIRFHQYGVRYQDGESCIKCLNKTNAYPNQGWYPHAHVPTSNTLYVCMDLSVCT